MFRKMGKFAARLGTYGLMFAVIIFSFGIANAKKVFVIIGPLRQGSMHLARF